MAGMLTTHLTSLPLLHRGKVRDIYAFGENHLLVIQTDRISAFDVILEDPIPNKGKVLTALSNFWFKKFGTLMPNHMTDIDPLTIVSKEECDQVAGRAIVVKKCKPLPVEAIVRGYIIGSGWKDYQKTQQICGQPLPSGLQEAQQLPEILFTPSTKAPVGEHDENISFHEMSQLVGDNIAKQVRDLSIQLYSQAAAFAHSKHIIIADTKFEFGLDEDNQLCLIDEILTPDSSRFWPAQHYQIGGSPPSFDKQFVRDWLEKQPWDKRAPAPRLPAHIIEQTAQKYEEALRLLTTAS